MNDHESGSVVLKQKHPLWIRWTHWVNFPVLTLMVISGFQILWASSEDAVPFIPEAVWKFLGLNNHLSIGMAVHFALMWIFTLNGIAYVLYLLFSGEWRESVPQLKSFVGAIQVVLHDLGLRKEPLPPGKFNHAQRIAYTSVVVFGVIALISGIAIYKPIQMSIFREILGGYERARTIHLLVAVAFVGFFAVHLAQVLKAGWNHFQSMVTGEEVEDEK